METAPMTNFIEKIVKINELASQFLAQGKAKDSVEAQRMAEEAYGASSEMTAFNKAAEKTVKEFQDYGERVRKNDMKQPRSPR